MTDKHGIKVEYIDRNANPGVDFFRYANGRYLDTAKLPTGYPRWGAFLELRELSLNRLHDMVQEFSQNPQTTGTNAQKIGDLFASGMDEAKIAAEGTKALSGELALIRNTKTRTGFAKTIARLHDLGVGVFFGFGSQQSFTDSTRMIAAVGQGGIAMGERDYYVDTDEASVERRRLYVEHIARMFQLLGEKPKVAKRHAQAVLAIETELATASMEQAKMRDPKNIDHLMTVDELQKLVPSFNFGVYFKALQSPSFESINVAQPDFFKALETVLAKSPKANIRAYLRWYLITSVASYLSSNFENEDFSFFGTVMTGVKEQQPRWKRVVNVVNGCLGEAIGELYVAKFFPPEAKQRVLGMIENGKAVMRQALESADWISDSTRKNLLGKLDKTVWKIGYPEKWLDYSALSIDRSSYVGNVLRARTLANRRDINKIGTERDKLQWYMTPQTVNAYADPGSNEVVFPAAILQPPFFDFEADDAANYGGILVVILHEFGHLFDDSGALYDADGNVNMQWTESDFEHFMKRVQLIRDQFGKFSVGNNVHLKGDLVSGEAAADLNGARLSYRALQLALEKTGRKTIDGYTDEQRFFIAFGQIWAEIVTPAYAEKQAKEDPHPAAQFRVNGTLANMDEFPKAFGLPDNCPLMLPPAQRCHIW